MQQQFNDAEWSANKDRLRSDFENEALSTPSQFKEYVATLAASDRNDCLMDLVCKHIEECWQRGCGVPRIEDYVTDFGSTSDDFASVDDVPVDVFEVEFIARHGTGPDCDHPRVEEYRQRFPGRPDVVKQLLKRCAATGRFVRVRQLGEGGLGRVWLAFDCHLRRSVAIKEVLPVRYADPSVFRLLEEEARLMATLDHPSIVAVHEFHEPEGECPFVVMNLIEGETLRDVIRRGHCDDAPGLGKLRLTELIQSCIPRWSAKKSGRACRPTI